MSTEENKALVRRYMVELFQRRNFAIVDELVAPDYINHNAGPNNPPGAEGERQIARYMQENWPDTTGTIDFMVAEGDKVVVYETMHGTHQRAAFGAQPTGKPFTLKHIVVYRVNGGKVTEGWSDNIFDFMEQIGVIPTPG